MTHATRLCLGYWTLAALATSGRSAEELAGAARVSLEDASRVLQELRRADLVVARADGIVRLARPPEDITALDLWRALDLLDPVPDGRATPLWRRLREAKLEVLASTSLQELIFPHLAPGEALEN